MGTKDCLVVQIGYHDTKERLLKKHYARRMPSISFAYGIIYQGTIQGVVTFGKPASNQLCKGICGQELSSNVIELNRLVINEGMPKNTASILVSKAIKLLPRNLIIVSYADTGMTHVGYIYQATNFLYTGCTKPRTDVDTGSKHSRHYSKDIDYSKRKYRTAKHRYVYFKNRKHIKYLKYKQEPYPKGEVTRYDTVDTYTPSLFSTQLLETTLETTSS